MLSTRERHLFEVSGNIDDKSVVMVREHCGRYVDSNGQYIDNFIYFHKNVESIRSHANQLGLLATNIHVVLESHIMSGTFQIGLRSDVIGPQRKLFNQFVHSARLGSVMSVMLFV